MTETKNMNRRKILSRIPIVSVMFLIVVPIIAHFLFSKLGFNPTDDGFTLAYSRRIIEGQIPHRDFIIIRPFLSPLLHLPFVLWGGNYTYLLSRFFVWFQFTCMAWAGVYIIQKGLRLSFGNLEKICIALISLVVSAHTFPTMAWHTIDGLFFTTIGIALCFSEKQHAKLIGYFLIGMAYLCKQSFIFMAPFSIIILGDWRKIKYWLAILMPGILYIAFLLLTGAFQDAILQLTSQSDLFNYGFNTYNQPKLLLIVLLGYFSDALDCRKRANKYTPKEFNQGMDRAVDTLCIYVDSHIDRFHFWQIHSRLVLLDFQPDSRSGWLFSHRDRGQARRLWKNCIPVFDHGMECIHLHRLALSRPGLRTNSGIASCICGSIDPTKP